VGAWLNLSIGVATNVLVLEDGGIPRMKNQVALTCVRQLRNLAFDVEYVVHLDLDDDKSSRWGWL